ncbi:hypothetical protein [Nitratireductor soli]|uniref:hypothetical protein n=1 Tax=Nitratireductor soli TaxID=1670619 RepID=UPI00065DE62C|nr:hypothetical protein [Nitratireductor soli]
MLKIDAPTEDTVRHVAKHMRDGDVREFLAVSFAETREELAEILVERYGQHDSVFCFFDEEEPVGVGALIEGRPNVTTLLFFATDKFPSLALGIAKFTKNRLFPRYRAAGVHRIEAISIAGHDDAHRWIQMVGLSPEAVIPGFGKNGEAYHQFAWVADDVR